jgi:hypothetical protein
VDPDFLLDGLRATGGRHHRPAVGVAAVSKKKSTALVKKSEGKSLKFPSDFRDSFIHDAQKRFFEDPSDSPIDGNRYDVSFHDVPRNCRCTFFGFTVLDTVLSVEFVADPPGRTYDMAKNADGVYEWKKAA